MLEVDIDKNSEKLDDIPQEINRINKALRMRRRKGRDYRELSLRVRELRKSKDQD